MLKDRKVLAVGRKTVCLYAKLLIDKIDRMVEKQGWVHLLFFSLHKLDLVGFIYLRFHFGMAFLYVRQLMKVCYQYDFTNEK